MANIQGDNFVLLVGKIKYPNLTRVGENNSFMFKGKLGIPINSDDSKIQYVNISAWDSIAEALNDVSSTEYIKIHGHIEESSYSSKCRHCGGSDKKYWTEVVIDNFIIVR